MNAAETALEGLSPRVRGNPGPFLGEVSPSGSIPACAGEPRARLERPITLRVYPRVCGGTLHAAAMGADDYGLSPRVRGNLSEVLALAGEPGSIPACAGEPAWAASGIQRTGVYPRVCGGTTAMTDKQINLKGLSPRVRGNQSAVSVGGEMLGSIPACAGEPVHRKPLGFFSGVYPRVCGGTRIPANSRIAIMGLSPRVRGNRLRVSHFREVAGSIPACAGEPPTKACTTPTPRVYPRVCGGTVITPATTLFVMGLSPRVRGNPESERGGQVAYGSIPACAGEP